MKRLFSILMFVIVISSVFAGCSKGPKKIDDAYYAYVPEEITEETADIKGYNMAKSEMTFSLSSDEWDLDLIKANSFIKIYVNEDDEVLDVVSIRESDVFEKVLTVLKAENNLE